MLASLSLCLAGSVAGQNQLPLDGLGQTLGEEHDAALVALGLIDVEPPLTENDVFDSQACLDIQTAGLGSELWRGEAMEDGLFPVLTRRRRGA